MAAESAAERGSGAAPEPGSQESALSRMLRVADRPDGVKHLVRILAETTGGQAFLVDAHNRPLHASPGVDRDVLGRALVEIDDIRSGRGASVRTESRGRCLSARPIGPGPETPVLVVSAADPDAGGVVADATRLLWLCWQVAETRRERGRADLADVQVREAVLHLLMLGRRDAAGRVAATLGPNLPDPARVFVVETEPGVRDVLAARLDDATHGQAWIVRCPVYTGHVIVIAPTFEGASDDVPDPVEAGMRDVLRHRRDACAGASGIAALREVPSGYEQAFHALTTAKASVDRYAVFNPGEELWTLLASCGRGWARRVLAPLLDHVPERPQDPDAGELRVTLESWLNFHHRAARQLKIHRNTLAARVSRLEQLLGCDLRDVRTQASVQLALRLLDSPQLPSDGWERSPGELFGTVVVRQWAQRQLAPLLEETATELMATLRAWLDGNAQVEAAAVALGLSDAGTRKRLQRIEQLLGRSLLHGPSARYALLFALRVHDGAGFPQPMPARSEQPES